MRMTLLSDTDFLSSFLKIDWLEAIRDFYRAEHLYIVPGVYREISRTGAGCEGREEGPCGRGSAKIWD